MQKEYMSEKLQNKGCILGLVKLLIKAFDSGTSFDEEMVGKGPGRRPAVVEKPIVGPGKRHIEYEKTVTDVLRYYNFEHTVKKNPLFPGELVVEVFQIPNYVYNVRCAWKDIVNGLMVSHIRTSPFPAIRMGKNNTVVLEFHVFTE